MAWKPVAKKVGEVVADSSSLFANFLKIGNFALRIDPILLLSPGQILFHGPDLSLSVDPGADLFLGLGSSRLLGPDPSLLLSRASTRASCSALT